MEAIKSALRSKTMWFGIAIAVLSTLQGLVLKLEVSSDQQAMIGGAIGVAVMILRALTTVPLSQK